MPEISAIKDGPILILVNPKARAGRLQRQWAAKERQIREALDSSKSKMDFVFTTPERSGTEVVRQALKEGAKRVVVIGGDGTLTDAIQGFFENGERIPASRDAVVSVVPAGRGDDFFKVISGQISYSPEVLWNLGLEILRSGNTKAFDVGRYRWIENWRQESPSSQSRYFMNIASFGFPGLVVQQVQSSKNLLNKTILGRSGLAYGLHGFLSLPQYRPLSATIRVDGYEFFSGKFHSGFIMNGKYNAGGICWDEDATPDDGLFRVVLFESKNMWRMLSNTSKLINDTKQSIPGILKTEGKKIEIELLPKEKKLHPLFEIDGDSPEGVGTRGAIFEVLPGEISFQVAE